MNEQWINDLRAEPIDTSPRPGFKDELRATLIAEHNGVTTPAQPAASGHRRAWVLGAAAACVALLIGGLVVFTGYDQTLTPSTVPDPTPAVDPTVASLPPSTSVAPPPTENQCVLDTRTVLDDLLATRLSGRLPESCISSAVQSRIAETEASPPCWAACANGTAVIGFDVVRQSEFEQPSTGESGSSFEVVVTYANGDDSVEVVIERFDVTVDDDNVATLTAWDAVDVAIDINDAEVIVTEYLEAFDRGDFSRAAEILGGGETEFADRVDLDQLQLEGETTADLARALQVWCESAACSGGVVVSAQPSSSASIDVVVDLTGRLTTFRVVISEGTLYVVGVPGTRIELRMDGIEPHTVVGGLDFNRDGEPARNPSVFGYSALTDVDEAALFEDVSGVLGDADADTGWIPMPDAYACTGASEYRSLLWDDIRFVLAQSSVEPKDTYLAAWSIGEMTLAYSPPLAAEITESSGITTTEGIGLGTPVDRLENVEWDQSYREADQFFGLAGMGPVVFELDAADRVVAMSYEQNDC